LVLCGMGFFEFEEPSRDSSGGGNGKRWVVRKNGGPSNTERAPGCP